MASKRTIIRFGVGGIAMIAGLLTAGIAIHSYFDPFDDEAFSQLTWMAANPEARAAMARDIVRRLHNGMTADQVKDLLGQPSPVRRYSGGVDAYGNRLRYPETWSYYLGSWSGYGLDDAYLYVHLDSDKRVASVQISGG